MIGPGDVLQISIFEVGAPLFSGRSGAATPGAETSAAGENLPLITVDRDGQALVPYVGLVHAAGLTANAVAAKIQAGLTGKSQSPQVVVGVRSSVTNTVMVIGDVKKPGRIPLTLAGERVLDAIAEAGGAENATPDNVVRLTRGADSAMASLGALHADSQDDIELRPQDRVEVDYRPRAFTIFGAAGKVQQVPFQSPRVSLAEAVARAGGPSDQQADPSAVFVFRYEPSAFDGEPLPGAKPVVYRLNLLKAQSYFLAQRFEMKSRDLIYIANAGSNQPSKLLQILNLFFQPFYTGKVISQ
jgi:polysaccharide export outer membrane protein